MVDQESSSVPPLAFFGRTWFVYVEVDGHPQPSQTHLVYLGSTSLLNYTRVSVFQSSPTVPRFSFEYAVSIPPVEAISAEEEHLLLFIATFNGICPTYPSTTLSHNNIRVISREREESYLLCH